MKTVTEEKLKRSNSIRRRSSGFRRMSSKAIITSKAYRVLAPYAVFGMKEEIKINKTFQYYIERKPELLCKDLSNYLSDMVDLRTLLHECLWMLKIVTKAEGANLYMVDKSGSEIYLSGNLEANERNRLNWCIRKGTTIAAYVASTMDAVMVDQLGKDSRFPEGIPYKPLSSAVLCVPIIRTTEDCYAVFELYKVIGQEPFSIRDQEFVAMVTTWMSSAIYENNHRVAVQKQIELNTYLLDVTRCYFSDPPLLKDMISEMVNFSRMTLGASRARFYIFEEKTNDGWLTAKLYDEYEEFQSWYKRQRNVVLNNEQGIVEYVTRTGETLNIKDATTDSRFQKVPKPGLITRSVLCMPISAGNQILGVVQAENKKDGGHFTFLDEMLFKTFAVYCSLALHYSTNHKLMNRNQILTPGYSKMLFYHLDPCIHEFEDFVRNPFPEIPLDFNQFNWYIPKKLKPDMPKYILYMFLKIIGSCFLVLENTIKFILEVKKAYNDNPFHNFEHAFIFTHSVYLILLKNPKKFTVTEKQGLLIGGFCHALDRIDRAHLYKDYIDGNYAFFVTSQLLKNCKIFRYLTPDDYNAILNEIKEAILATDWYSYLKVKPILYDVYKRNTFNWKLPAHRSYAKSVIMSTAECSFCWKGHGIVRKSINNYFKEIYKEIEFSTTIGNTPIKNFQEMMGLEQLNLFNILWLSCMQLMKYIFPNTSECYDLVFNLTSVFTSSASEKMWVISNSMLEA